jgi:hypothetical protein
LYQALRKADQLGYKSGIEVDGFKSVCKRISVFQDLCQEAEISLIEVS